MKEYKTTFKPYEPTNARFSYSDRGRDLWGRPLDVIPPDGAGWRLISTCNGDKHIFYTWERDVPSEEG